jgi:hypothetical protein
MRIHREYRDALFYAGVYVGILVVTPTMLIIVAWAAETFLPR